jgi:hypothetical protein
MTWLWSMKGRQRKRTFSSRVPQPPTARGRMETVGYIQKLSAGSYRPSTCQYLAGEPRQRLFCGAPTQPGSSYCEHHHALTHIKCLTTAAE